MTSHVRSALYTLVNPPEKKLANAPLCSSSSSHSVSVSRDRPTKSVEPKITDRVCTDNSVAYWQWPSKNYENDGELTSNEIWHNCPISIFSLIDHEKKVHMQSLSSVNRKEQWRSIITLKLSCCKKRQKIPGQETGWGIGDIWKLRIIPNWS